MSELTPSYADRNAARTATLNDATMNFVGYFMGLGDDQATAEGKVGQLSTEVAQYIFVYTLGNTQSLIDGINASGLTFMDAAAKAEIIGNLTAV
jgi:hypothetical protein